MVKIESLKDRLYMAPIKKYEKYGRFPYKMVIQILLVLFTSCQVLLIVNHSTTYSYSQYTLFNKLFLNKNVQGSDTTITNTYNIYGIPSFTNYIQTTVDRYYDINSHTIDNYNYNYDSDGLKHPPKLLFEYFDNTKAIESSSLIEYSLTTNNLGPFSQSDIKDFLNNVKNIHIKFSLIHKLDQYIDLPSQCYEWTIIQKYNYAQHGTIVAELSTDRHTCDTSDCNV